MRLILMVSFSISVFFAHAQKIEKFYDYQWHECKPDAARFYGVIRKTDSGWHRQDYFIHDVTLQMDGIYEDSACKIHNGMFYYFYADKRPSSVGRYVHGKKQGVWVSFNANGIMSDSAFFDNGNPVGIQLGWYPSGNPSDSAFWQNDGSGTVINWFDNGNPSSAGRYINWTRPHGKWQFFHDNGKLSALETYVNGQLTDKQYFDENGAPQDTTYHDHWAEFPGGTEGWQNYLYKHLYFPPDYKIVNADKAVSVIAFTIDENGKVQDVYVKTPFYPQFDKIAVDAIKRSPVWKPAIRHNRRVKTQQQQAVTFSQEEQP